MKKLWDTVNKIFTIEGAVSAFLVMNIIGWMLITMGAGALICKFLGFSIAGNVVNSSASSAIIAAPVGVTSSVSLSICLNFTFDEANISLVAGTGTLIVPCAHSINPYPSFTILEIILSGLILLIRIAVPTISTIESIAPTS